MSTPRRRANVTRFSVDLNQEAAAALYAAKADLAITTRVGTVRRSLFTTARLAREFRAGTKIILERPSGERVEFPMIEG